MFMINSVRMSFLLIRGARQLVTMRGQAGPRRGSAMRDLGIIENGSLLIEDGVIHSAGPASRIENLRKPASLRISTLPAASSCRA